MKITSDVFDAYQKCPTKCWLRATGESCAGNAYAEWVKTQNGFYRTTEMERLIADFAEYEVARTPAVENTICAPHLFDSWEEVAG